MREMPAELGLIKGPEDVKDTPGLNGKKPAGETGKSEGEKGPRKACGEACRKPH